MNLKYSNILVVRTDRLGDCILSTPAVSILKKIFPSASIDVLTTPYTADVFAGNPCVREVILDDPKVPFFSAGFLGLVRKIRSKSYDACFILHLTARSAFIPFLAGIPTRVAPATKIYQLLATRRIRQKRSECLMNEADYNSRLVLKFLNVEMEHPPSSLYFGGDSLAFVKSFLDAEFKKTMKTGFDDFRKAGGRMVVVHPGCGGSALNMSADRYIELMERLRGMGYAVFLSTGPAEDSMKNQFMSRLSFAPFCYGEDMLKSPLVLKNTFALLSLADAVVAPSTGIMHAAVALGKPVIGLFCPIFVCTPERWGPDPGSPAKRFVMKPDVFSSVPGNVVKGGRCEKCVGEACGHYNCMDALPLDEILHKVAEFAGRTE